MNIVEPERAGTTGAVRGKGTALIGAVALVAAVLFEVIEARAESNGHPARSSRAAASTPVAADHAASRSDLSDTHRYFLPVTRKVAKAGAILGSGSDTGPRGRIIFTRVERGMLMEVEMEGLAPGEHMFHLHQYGDVSEPKGNAAGPHFTPLNMLPTAADSHPAFMGYWHLGSLSAGPDGRARLARIDSGRTFEGPAGILGLGVVVHDLDGATRIACGVIGVMKP